MDGEVHSRNGLLVSLVLMNAAAIALFFTTPQRDATNPSIRIKPSTLDEKVMGEDATNSFPCDQYKEMIDVTGARSDVNIRENSMNVHGIISSVEPNLNDKTQVMSPNEMNHSPIVDVKRGVQPPFTVALKNFLGETKSSFRIFFEGLKIGYTKKRRPTVVANQAEVNMCTVRKSPSQQLRSAKLATSTRTQKSLNDPHRNPLPSPNPNLGLNSPSLQDQVSTEIIMDVLSSTQTRTNELIQVFSEKVVPAIERMNERVADAIRLEKHLDSYTSALISAIDSLVCSYKDEKLKNLRTGSAVLSKLETVTSHLSTLSLREGSRTNYCVEGLGKGENSFSNKRPVFKTLAARCWYTKMARKRKKSKVKMCSDSGNAVITMKQSSLGPTQAKQQEQKLAIEHIDKFYKESNSVDKSSAVISITERTPSKLVIDYEDSISHNSPQQNTIHVDKVLGLTSDGRNYQQIVGADEPCPTPLTSDSSVSSGAVDRTLQPNVEDDGSNKFEATNSGANLSRVAIGPPRALKVSTKHAIEPSSGSGSSVLWNLTNEGHGLEDKSEVIGSFAMSSLIAKSGGSRVTFSREWENTRELVIIFRQQNQQQRDFSIAKIALSSLHVFGAWSDFPPFISMQQYIMPEVKQHSIAMCSSVVGVDQQQLDAESKPLSHDPRIALTITAITSRPSSDEMPQDRLLNVVNTSDEICQQILHNLIAPAELNEVNVKLNLQQKRQLYIEGPAVSTQPAEPANQSSFGDIMKNMDEDDLASKSQVSVKSESSFATFFSSQPEFSDEAFYECSSTMSDGTSRRLRSEEEGSSILTLENIQEEDTMVLPIVGAAAAVSVVHQTALNSSIQSWLSQSTEDITDSEHSSYDVACGTDDEAEPCSSSDFSSNESKINKKKKKKWGTKFFKKLLMKKKSTSNLTNNVTFSELTLKHPPQKGTDPE